MRNKILAANWKMNLNFAEVIKWRQVFLSQTWDASGKELRIYPSSIYIESLNELSHVGAQNFYFEDNGAYTGEISLAQLQSIGAKSVIIGHSERRTLFHEDKQLITRKVNACVTANTAFILCCGEAENIRKEGAHLRFIQEQLTTALHAFAQEKLHLLTIAYEPIWAIGTGLTASSSQISEMHQAIRNLLLELYGESAHFIPILYGGSVTPENAKEIFSCAEVGGALVGGASLDPKIFHQIWEQL